MTAIASARRSSFGMRCVRCNNELIPPNGPSTGMSATFVIFGNVGNVTVVLRPSSDIKMTEDFDK